MFIILNKCSIKPNSKILMLPTINRIKFLHKGAGGVDIPSSIELALQTHTLEIYTWSCLSIGRQLCQEAFHTLATYCMGWEGGGEGSI